MFLIPLLCAVAFAAGLIDAIAGGGGLLTVPTLLVALPDARLALGTNKAQSVFGSGTALVSFARAGRVDKKRFTPTFLAALVGSILGARLVLAIRPEALRPVVLVLLLGVATFFASRGLGRPKKTGEAAGDAPPPRRPMPIAERHPVAMAVAIAFVIGGYDGFFGPGTGTFLITLYTTVFADDLTRATANAKVANFASNLGAVGSFALAGKIDLRLALPMAAMQALGGFLGARVAVRGGERLIRAAVLAVTLALALRLAWQIASTG